LGQDLGTKGYEITNSFAGNSLYILLCVRERERADEVVGFQSLSKKMRKILELGS